MARLFCSLCVFFSLLSCSPFKTIKHKSANNLRKEVYQVSRKEEQIKNGNYREYYDRKLITEGTYSLNVRSGLWHFYDVKNQMTFSGAYDQGTKHGKWTYYLNGNLTSEIFYNRGLADSVKGYHSSGGYSYKLKYAVDRSGICTAYFANGQVKELIPLKHSKMEGSCFLYFENGQVHSEILYSEGNPHSIIKTFNTEGREIDGGNLSEGNGKLITYYPPEKLGPFEMQVYSISHYKNGQRNGLYRSFNKSGTLLSEGKYKNNQKTGEWKLYSKEGVLMSAVNYNNETYTEIKRFDSDYYYTCSPGEDMGTMPTFQGGESKLIEYIQSSVVYPKNARLNNIQGKCFVQFVISQIGELESLEIIKSVNPDIDQEVMRIVKAMPRWNPGLESGIPVRVYFNLPVNFKMQ